MDSVTLSVLIILAFIAITLVWRYAPLPCPPWLDPLLESPYFDAVAGSSMLIERAGIGPGMHVLDAGCGSGRVTVPISQAVGPTGHVTALDLQRGMLDKLRRRVSDKGITNVDVVQAGLGQGRLPEGVFDVALMVAVLGEVPDKSAAMAEIHNALKPGGLLSITEALPDPHYQTLSRVRTLASITGFQEREMFGGMVGFTINLVKDA